MTNDWNDDSIRNLSPQLIGRISALSYAFRPYRFWQDSVMIGPYSPERGQLLLALVSSDLDSTIYQNIFQQVTFQDAYLVDAILPSAYLVYANLSGATLDFAILEHANLNKAIMKGVSLNGTVLSAANLSNVKLDNAHLKDTYLVSANLRNTDLRNTNLRDVNLRDVGLWGTKVSEKEWIKKLKLENAVNTEDIEKIWIVDTIPQRDVFGEYYFIKEKN